MTRKRRHGPMAPMRKKKVVPPVPSPKKKGRVIAYRAKLWVPENDFLPLQVGWSDFAGLRSRSRAFVEQRARYVIAGHRDQYAPRQVVPAPYSAEEKARLKVLKGLRFRIVVIRHKAFTERHLIGYRVEVVREDQVRQVVRWEENGQIYRNLHDHGEKGTLFLRRETALEELGHWPGGTLLRVFRKGAAPVPVPPEEAAKHRAEACARRKRYPTPKAAIAASFGVQRRSGVKLIYHPCAMCGGFHLSPPWKRAVTK